MPDKSGFDRVRHWDEVYGSRPSEELGWYQRIPEASLALAESLGLPKNAPIIDIGGGDSSFAQLLMKNGFNDLSVLDISEQALQRSRKRLGSLQAGITWIRTDILDFQPEHRYALWHDRACFHFLTDQGEVENYVKLVEQSTVPGGHVIIGAFSEKGPERCSGLKVKRYDLTQMKEAFSGFRLIEYRYLDHHTPSGGSQNYIFCLFETKT